MTVTVTAPFSNSTQKAAKRKNFGAKPRTSKSHGIRMGEEQQQQQQQQQEEQLNTDTEVAEATQENQHEYTWPVIRFDVPPHRTYHFYNQFRTSSIPNNFLKAIKWYIFSDFTILFQFFQLSWNYYFIYLLLLGHLMVHVFLQVLRIIRFAFSHCKLLRGFIKFWCYKWSFHWLLIYETNAVFAFNINHIDNAS